MPRVRLARRELRVRQEPQEPGASGPAGPTFVATGLVNPDGSVFPSTTGPLPTITHPGTGQYTFTITGMGTGCPLPQLTPFASATILSYQGGSCGGGTITTNVSTGNGLDSFWVYMVVGVGSGAAVAMAPATLPTNR